ncbi:uncharacterized protein RJT21DRAFT_9545 [Scheffersomyces amazonensis]|uniref:uncharacterized protein n=1 Tax=Scheffersomyces amazonensis TaxID=1078765 RepID=UPI00315C68C9
MTALPSYSTATGTSSNRSSQPISGFKGWQFVICERIFSSDYTVFVSKDSVGKYSAFKHDGNHSITKKVQHSGVGIPLLKVVTHEFSLTKMLTIYKYFINEDSFRQKGFDSTNDCYKFCKVTKNKHIDYTTYILSFTPDRFNPSVNFEVVMFAHNVLPIIDYEFQGNFYRWIKNGPSSSWYKYNYINYLLNPNQNCLARFWDKQTYKINRDKSIDNPLLGNNFKKFFSFSSRYPKDDYTSLMQLASLEELVSSAVHSYNQTALLDVLDLYEPSADVVKYESIHSVNMDSLIKVCMSLVFKREEDITAARKKRNMNNYSYSSFSSNSLQI